MKLTLEPLIKRQVTEILAPLKDPELWKQMGISFAPNPYAVVRLEGAPGTGKSALAAYMARRMEKPPIHVDFAGVASPILGDTEKRITESFAKAAETETPTIIFEECESLMFDRAKLTEDEMFKLSFMDTLLKEIDKFIARPIPSLLIFTTNYPQLLDAALESRVTDVVYLSPPVGLHAERLWASKLPESMNTRTLEGIEQLRKLSELGATPRQMEQAILKVCRRAAFEKRMPTFADFQLPS